LERTPPELSGDITESGIAVTGGGALLRGFDRRIEREVGIPIRIVEDPLLSVVRGTAKLLKEESLLKRVCIRGV
jgi:rod shape-determining protein MreB